MKQMFSGSKPAQILSLAVALILVLLPFHALLTTWAGSNFGYLDTWRIWKEIILIATLPMAGVIVWRSSELRRWLLASWIVRLFAAYALLHIILGLWALHSKVNGIGLAYALIINLRFVGFFILCAVAAAGSHFLIRNWDKLIFLPASVVVIFGLIQRLALPHDFLRHFGYGPDTIPAYQTVDAKLDYQRVQSTLRGANPLGAYLLLIMTAAVTMLRKNHLFFIGILGAGLLTLFYSYSRSAWIGLALSLGTLLILEKRKIAGKWLALVAVLSVLMLGAGLYSLRSNNVFQNTIFHTSETSNSSESTNEQRLEALEAGVRDITREPLGRGPGTAGPASVRNNDQPRIAENYFLQIGQEVGVLGMALLISIFGVVGYQLWQRRNQDLARILLASLVGLTFVNLVSHAWTDDTLSYIWWGLAGIAIAPGILSSKSKHGGKKKEK